MRRKFYSKVWFNTLRLAAVQTTYCFQKPGIKPDDIINFLSNEPPIQKQLYVSDTAGLAPRRLICTSGEAFFTPAW
jgi:hypothetical protein